MASRWLRGYLWDETAQRYRSDRTGRFVAREKIVSLLERSINGREERIAIGTLRALDGELPIGVWQTRTATLLQRQHMQNAALAAGGWDRLTPVDLQRIQNNVSDACAHLSKFAQDIVDGKVSQAQAMNRIHMYMGKARVEFYAVERVRIPVAADQVLQGRRVLGAAEHCDDCIAYADMGWVSADQLPVPGDASRCNGNCRCSIEYKIVSASED